MQRSGRQRRNSPFVQQVCATPRGTGWFAPIRPARRWYRTVNKPFAVIGGRIEWERAMKKLLCLALASATALSAAACDTPQGQNAAGGALLGGAAGAVIGGATTGHAGGALVGGVLGAAGGAMIGSAMTPQGPPPRCAEWYYDYYGNRVCRAYY
jgi:hypothetical protein